MIAAYTTPPPATYEKPTLYAADIRMRIEPDYDSHPLDGLDGGERADTEVSDYYRRWANDEWHYIGVMASIEVRNVVHDWSWATTEPHWRPFLRTHYHTVMSDGLWGIEDDADDYHTEVFAEQKAQLIADLRAMGYTVEE